MKNPILYAILVTLIMAVLIITYNMGLDQGWRECIEENNLYSRYAD